MEPLPALQEVKLTLPALLHKRFPSTPTGEQVQAESLAITLVSCHGGHYEMLEMIMLGISIPVGVAVYSVLQP